MIRIYLEPDSAKLQDKGENHLLSGHLRTFNYNDSHEETLYTAKVQSSMKDKLNDVQVSIKKKDVSIVGACACARGGSSPCSHIATVLLHINQTISCTDKMAVWSQRGTINYEIQTIEGMIGSIPPETISDSIRDMIREKCLSFFMEENVIVPAAWNLRAEDSEVEESDDLSDLGAIIQNVDFSLCSSKKAFLESVCSLTNEKILEIAHATVGQRKNMLYLKYKCFRLTASNFGYIIAAMNRNSYPPSLFGRLLNTANLDKVKAIQWGIQNEKNALQALLHLQSYKENFNSALIGDSGLYYYIPVASLVQVRMEFQKTLFLKLNAHLHIVSKY